MWLLFLFLKEQKIYIYIYFNIHIFLIFEPERSFTNFIYVPLEEKNYNKIKTLLFYCCSKVGQIIKSKSYYKYIKWQIEQGLYFWRKDSFKVQVYLLDMMPCFRVSRFYFIRISNYLEMFNFLLVIVKFSFWISCHHLQCIMVACIFLNCLDLKRLVLLQALYSSCKRRVVWLTVHSFFYITQPFLFIWAAYSSRWWVVLLWVNI